jgi:hypothetical protein
MMPSVCQRALGLLVSESLFVGRSLHRFSDFPPLLHWACTSASADPNVGPVYTQRSSQQLLGAAAKLSKGSRLAKTQQRPLDPCSVAIADRAQAIPEPPA